MRDPVIARTIADSTPAWPDGPARGDRARNIVVVLFDDMGFSDLGCYGSEIETPVIDGIAARGLRYTGFHTTAMCSTTRAALLTGRNHHSAGVGCLANFDSGFPGYRGKLSTETATLAEMLRPAGYRNYMVGKWHVTPLPESGPTGPFDGWPLARGFDRFYGFLDAETDHYAPELVRDNHHIEAPGTFDDGYHLSADLIDEAISYVKAHIAGAPANPFFLYVSYGAVHAPHQAPAPLIDSYESVFAKGYDQTRRDRLARQVATGIVPNGTELPERNDWVRPWADLSEAKQRVFIRLQAAYAAMLDHADQQLGRLIDFFDAAGLGDDTILAVLSDNGASQEGGPNGQVNSMAMMNLVGESTGEKLERLSDVGGPNSFTNYPLGWAMAANTPLKRYKQNTHGGGVRDPLVLAVPGDVNDPGGLRHDFCHVVDLAPTLLELVGIEAPEVVAGVAQKPIEGTSFAATVLTADAPRSKTVQYFEMFSHRGLWQDGWKAVAFHQPATAIEDDVWELYHLDEDFAENTDLADAEPDRLAAMIERWWVEAESHQVLPLDDRFAERFAENAARTHADRVRYDFWAGMGHLPTDVAPDVRGRSHRIAAVVDYADGDEGVLIAHGDTNSGYSLYVADGRLVFDLNVGGAHQVVRSPARLRAGATELASEIIRVGEGGTAELSVDGDVVAEMAVDRMFKIVVSFSGLDVGLDRGSPVGDYVAPFAYTGTLHRVEFTLHPDQELDHGRVAAAELARE